MPNSWEDRDREEEKGEYEELEFNLDDFENAEAIYNEEISYPSDFRRRKIFFRLLGFAVLIIFIMYVLAGFMRVFTLPPLDFLDESGKLLEDPKIAGLQEAVVKIKVDGGGVPGIGRNSSRGSGFNIDKNGLIITNRHVVEDGEAITVSFEDEGVYRASEVIKPSDNLDVAFLKLDEGENLPVTSLKEAPELSVEDEVIVIGNPLGFSWVANKGVLVDLVEIGSYGPHLEVAAPVYPGSSGSPVFNSDGEVIGLIYAAREVSEDEVRGIALNIKEVSRLLEEEEL